METISLIANILAIILAILAIWLAIEHKKQSDRLNKDTTEKLARIEAFATMTKEDAFRELGKWGDAAREGRILGGGEGKETKETLEKLKKELQETTRKEIDEKIALAEKKIEQSVADVTKVSTIAEMKKEFQTLKEEMSKIQQRSAIKAIDLEKRIRLEELKKRLSPEQKEILRTIFNNQKLGKPTFISEVKRGYYLLLILTLLYLDLAKWSDDRKEWVVDAMAESIL